MKKTRETITFSEEDLLFLKKNYKKGNTKELAEKLGKELDAVRKRVHALGLTRKRISPDKIREAVKTFYRTKTAEEIAKEVGVNSKTVRRYFREMLESGEDEYMVNEHPYIHGDTQHPWSEHDIEILKKYYRREGTDCGKRMKVSHSKSSIITTAHMFGLKVFWFENRGD